MNSKNSSVVWGVPLLQGNGNKFGGSIFSNGSATLAMTMASLGVAVAALGITMAAKKKAASAKAKKEE